ncbi:MAG: aminotransferase class V-fold PLP-dependent enzyme [Candidatus Moraniibacteriota bacterium]|nr:MAG: aminotransferase class V-fold PLP-dependent enzyme [Candidatus Moranbacteria bacterium]
MSPFETIKEQFPVFSHHPNLCYLDSPASTLVPKKVIDKLCEYYENYPVNVARGLYPLSERATKEMELVREKSARFFNAHSLDEIIFTRNTTESINLLARVLLPKLKKGDGIAITAMEHHANFVPWQQLCKMYGLELRIINFDSNGTISPDSIRENIDTNIKIFSFVHVSNVFGTILDAKKFIQIAKEKNPDIITILDTAQSAGNSLIDVQSLDCDFLACSGHKMFGPKGVGILYGKKKYLDTLDPFLYGGEMVTSVTDDESTFQKPPHRFEAGTPSIADIIAFGSALDFIDFQERNTIALYEKQLSAFAWNELEKHFGQDIILYGPEPSSGIHSGILSFTLSGIHPHDTAQLLGQEGICVRAGSHCAMPLHQRMHTEHKATIRIGLSIYNNESDIERLIDGLEKIKKFFPSH